MRTYLGKFVNNGEAPVFVASVKEDGFDVTEELLRVAAADEAKYYSAPEVNDERFRFWTVCPLRLTQTTNPSIFRLPRSLRRCFARTR